jgi:hypothetical protein
VTTLADLLDRLAEAEERAARLEVAHTAGRCPRDPLDVALYEVRHLREQVAILEGGP